MGCVDNTELLGAVRDQGVSIDEKLRSHSAIGTCVSYSHCLILGKPSSHGSYCTDPHEKGFAPFFITEFLQNHSLLPTHIQNLLVVRGGLSGDSLLLHRHKKTAFLLSSCKKLEKRSKSNGGKFVCFTLQ